MDEIKVDSSLDFLLKELYNTGIKTEISDPSIEYIKRIFYKHTKVQLSYDQVLFLSRLFKFIERRAHVI